jgi:hypothetical protein
MFKFSSREGDINHYLGSCTVTLNELNDKTEFELKNTNNNTAAGLMIVESVN